MAQKLIAGNWKSNGSFAELEAFVREMMLSDGLLSRAEVVLCPPFVYLHKAVTLCGAGVSVGAQNCSAHASGAFTGEVTADMLVDIGAQWVIIGHSERREMFGDSNDVVLEKVRRALASGLKVMLCVGESLEQRERGEAKHVVAAQLESVLALLTSLESIVVAYEPIWAIGTGRTASAEDAQEMHASIKRQIVASGLKGAGSVKVLYGGSVKGSNAAELFSQKDIDGALVGGASLKAKDFLAIIAES